MHVSIMVQTYQIIRLSLVYDKCTKFPLNQTFRSEWPSRSEILPHSDDAKEFNN